MGVLVFIHELGHFLVAKWAGVKVETFSLGFGRSILRRKWGETEYRVAWLPLGGYVKMLGETPGDELPEAERHRSFRAQPIPRRIAIALAGPGMNLLLPVLVVAGMVMSGISKPTSLIGAVDPGTPAATAGLMGGDRVVSIAGEETWRWEDLARAVSASVGKPLELEVEREGERLTLQVSPQRDPETERIIFGAEHSVLSAVLGLPDPDGLAARAGLRTGDRVRALNGRAIKNGHAFETQLARARGPLEIEVVRGAGESEQVIRTTLRDGGEGAWSLERMGAVRVDFTVVAVEPGSPAKKAGLQFGDLFLSVNGEPVRGFALLAEKIRAGEGAAMSVTVLRAGVEHELELTPKERAIEREGKVESAFRIGVHGGPPHVPGEMREEVVRNPLSALWIGAKRTGEIFVLTIYSIGQLVSGNVGLENLAGPIGIGKFAGDYFQEEGWHPFLNLLAVISVNLAILNLLPIPVLDGGHIALSLVEAVRGVPNSLRILEIANAAGLAFIAALFGLVFWNDVMRYWADFANFLQGLG